MKEHAKEAAYDAVMIGFGKGAKTLAADLAGRGRKVAIVERSARMYGGTCINVGCIPTKSLVRSAELSAAEGGDFARRQARYAEAFARKEALVGALRQKNYEKLAGNANVDVITGTASLIDEHRIRIESGDSARVIRGEKIFLNTGSAAFVPPIAGATESRYVYTSETLLARADLPARLVIVGGGYIGLEFASIYANFGSRVTVLNSGGEAMPRDDREIVAEIVRVLTRKVDFRLSARIESIRDEEDCAAVRWTEDGAAREIEADAVLIATGRRPDLEGLGLNAAGVAVEGGAILTDERLRTSVPHIFAMGDCKGGPMFTYIGLDDYRIVRDALGGGSRTTSDRGAVPYSVFVDPPYSHVGMTEAEARAAGLEIATARLAAAAIPKARVLQKTDGLLKAVVERGSGRMLGASLFCAESHEMINLVKLAIDAGLSYTVLRDGIFTHPTMSEAFNDLFAALD